jgi:hypothetical protein
VASPPHPLFFVNVASKGVAGGSFASVDSNEVISPLSATLTRGLGSVDFKRVIDAFCL